MLKHLKSRDDWSEKSLGAKGFTLIELLVVVIILGILAGVAIFALGGLDKTANKNSCKNEKDTVDVAIQAYLTNNENATTVSLSDLTGGTDPLLKKTPKYWTVANNAPSRLPSSVGTGRNQAPDSGNDACV